MSNFDQAATNQAAFPADRHPASALRTRRATDIQQAGL